MKRQEFLEFCQYIRLQAFPLEGYEVIRSFFTEAEEGMRAGEDQFWAVAQSAAQASGTQREYAALVLCVLLSYHFRRFYLERGISESVFLDTMEDISVWRENYALQTGKVGVSAVMWLRYHLTGLVFRLGRLQFERAQFPDEGTPIQKGTAVLGVHIPQGQSLSEELCETSFQAAPSFFKQHFGMEPVAFTCHSWLLHPSLQEVLLPQSNIIRFQSGFTVYHTDCDQAQAIERIFGLAREEGAPLPEKTSLQRAAKAYLERGGSFGMGTGYRLI